MSEITVQTLRHSRRQPTGHREEKKKLEVFVARKVAARKQSVPNKRLEIRSPLMERSNRDLEKKSEQVKPLKKKMAEPVNKENIRPAVNKDCKSMTFTQSTLKTKNLKEKQIKEGKVELESTKVETKPPTKPVLGAYRGKIVQSKINSFRKNNENNIPEQNKAMAESQEKRPQSSASVPAKTMVRPSANSVKPKRPVIPPVASQIRPSTTLTTSKAELVTVRRTTQALVQQRPVRQKVQPVKPAVKNNLMSKKSSSGPAKALPEPQKKKPAPQLPTASKFSRPKESAEERKARLAEWRQSKGKVIKRPPMAVVMPSKYSVHKEEPEVKTELEEPKEEIRQLYWATMAEEDERELFTLKVTQIFGDCQKLVDEGCPREEVLSILDKQFENFPEAKKLSGYWECLARLEKRDGQLYKVIAVCEEAVSSGAQPLEELRAILADALEQLKPDPEESVRKESEEDLKSDELKAEVKEPVETAVKEKRRGRARAVKNEAERPGTPDKPPKSESTPEHGAVASSVIRFNVYSTPHLEKMKKLQMNERDSSIKSYKFLTPVRRSSRLECKSHRLPDMLKDHDPCVSGIDQLGELEDTDACSNAYIFRKNSALCEVTAKSATKKHAD